MSRQNRILSIVLSLVSILWLAGCVPTSQQGPIAETTGVPTSIVAATATATATEEVNTLISTAATSTPAIEQPPAPTAEMDPLAVTQAFYDWYLAAMGHNDQGEFRNLLVERAYRENPLLSETFIARVDRLLDSAEKGGFDPFLLAQDFPQDIYAQSVMVAGDTARVTVLRNWGPPVMDAIFAHWRRVEDVWLLEDVTPLALYESSSRTPEGTVQSFYAWYIEAVRSMLAGEAAAVDYHESDLLSETFKQQLDQLYANAEAVDPLLGLHYDPLLCAQDVPYHVTPDQAFIDGQTAALTARTSFQNQVILIDLLELDGGWLINDITCLTRPQDTARAFYTWYLGYIGDRGDGVFLNPLADRAYRGHPLLSAALVQEVDGMFDAQGAIGHDPFLLAQDVPARFTVEVGNEPGRAVVHFPFGEQCVAHVTVTMIEERGRWVISAITPLDPSLSEPPVDAVQTITSDAFGFSFDYPGSWVAQEMVIGGAGQPEDWPVTMAWMLMPAEVAEQLDAQNGPPDPDLPPIIPPINIEVVAGDQEALARVYGELDSADALPGVHADYVLQREPGYIHLIFAHPLRPEQWIVVTDWVTGFPGREAQSQGVAPARKLLLNSLQFFK